MSQFRVIASSLRIREGAGTSQPILGSLPRNTIVEPQDTSDDERWFFVETKLNGKDVHGWVFRDFLSPLESSSNGAPADAPAWLEIAEKEIGVVEVPGAGDNPRIIEYHKATTLKATDDSVPWCSSFVNWCMREAGKTGTGSAAARSWLNWGRKLDAPIVGCITVLKRAGSPSNGHVAFYVAEAGSNIRLLGGNQSDQVKISSFPKSMLLSYRWPND